MPNAPPPNFGATVVVENGELVAGAVHVDENTGRVFSVRIPPTAAAVDEIVPSTGTPQDGFGRHLARDGNRLVVGAQYFAGPGARSGLAYVFSKDP